MDLNKNGIKIKNAQFVVELLQFKQEFVKEINYCSNEDINAIYELAETDPKKFELATKAILKKLNLITMEDLAVWSISDLFKDAICIFCYMSGPMLEDARPRMDCKKCSYGKRHGICRSISEMHWDGTSDWSDAYEMFNSMLKSEKIRIEIFGKIVDFRSKFEVVE